MVPALTSVQFGQEDKMNWILISKGERVGDSTGRQWGGRGREGTKAWREEMQALFS